MIKIGMVDRYLYNWHTNYYPEMLHEAAAQFGIDAKITCVWAEQDAPNGKTTTQWCEEFGIPSVDTYEALIEQVDAIMVMCADDCYPHEALAQKALKSGKRVFCDKTFASTLEAAIRMFDLAQAHGTKLYSSSAKRYNPTILEYCAAREGKTAFCATMGPGDMVNYSIHQYEMIQTVMGCGAQSCIGYERDNLKQLLYMYEDGRAANFILAPKAVFKLSVSNAVEDTMDLDVHEYVYPDFFHDMLRFFAGGDTPVSREATLEIMAMQQAGRAALDNPGAWVELEQSR